MRGHKKHQDLKPPGKENKITAEKSNISFEMERRSVSPQKGLMNGPILKKRHKDNKDYEDTPDKRSKPRFKDIFRKIKPVEKTVIEDKQHNQTKAHSKKQTYKEEGEFDDNSHKIESQLLEEV